MSKETVARKSTENLDVDASTGVVPNERERHLEDDEEEEEEEEEGLDLARYGYPDMKSQRSRMLVFYVP